MRFFNVCETAGLVKMPLQPPKKTAAGYFLALTPPVAAPSVRWERGAWQLGAPWKTWADATRTELLQELIRSPKWFSRPPRLEIIDPLFSPWFGKTMQGVEQFFCSVPDVPGAAAAGWAFWMLEGLIMSSTAIVPIWKLGSVTADDVPDTISLFGDGDTIDGSEEGDEREILFDEIEEAPATAAPTRIRNREWDAKKFMAKERVREARLKAQIAIRVAEKEESRFVKQFGELDDVESRFSEYDLTDEDVSGSESELDAAED
jgi:hypothetical protein